MAKKTIQVNLMFWLLGSGLTILAITNQCVINYSNILLQFIISLIAGIVAIWCLAKTKQGVSLYKYCLSVRSEFKKINWPNKKDATKFTFGVLIMVLITGIILWTVDSLLIKLVSWLLYQRR